MDTPIGSSNVWVYKPNEDGSYALKPCSVEEHPEYGFGYWVDKYGLIFGIWNFNKAAAQQGMMITMTFQENGYYCYHVSHGDGKIFKFFLNSNFVLQRVKGVVGLWKSLCAPQSFVAPEGGKQSSEELPKDGEQSVVASEKSSKDDEQSFKEPPKDKAKKNKFLKCGICKKKGHDYRVCYSKNVFCYNCKEICIPEKTSFGDACSTCSLVKHNKYLKERQK